MGYDSKLIDSIEDIRRKNNVNWMNLVRLAFELDPVRSCEIVRQIVENDKKITNILEKIVNE